MENTGLVSSRFYRTAEWIWRLAYLNILWLFTTVIGVGVLGLFPATVAMFAVLRKWLHGEPDISIFSTYVKSLKKDFIWANLIGYSLLILAFILFFNYEYLGTISGLEHTFFSIAWYIAIFLFIVLVLFIFPVYVHFEQKFFHYFKTAIIVGLANPLALITLIVSFGLASYFFFIIPGFIPFYLASTVGWIIMWNATLSFRRIENKKFKLEAGEETEEEKEKRLNRKVFSWKRFTGK